MRLLLTLVGLGGGDALAVDWVQQAADDAKQDRNTVIFEGVTPDTMACDTTLRELPDGSWIHFMLAGGDTEPSPLNYTGVSRSKDHRRTWTKRCSSIDGPKGRLNYPDGFVSKDRQWLHFAYDDNRHRAVYYGAKLPPLR